MQDWLSLANYSHRDSLSGHWQCVAGGFGQFADAICSDCIDFDFVDRCTMLGPCVQHSGNSLIQSAFELSSLNGSMNSN